ncbi:MAG: hypothetical protein ACYC3Q_08925 [Gemmatimonadaceae bacterium]
MTLKLRKTEVCEEVTQEPEIIEEEVWNGGVEYIYIEVYEDGGPCPSCGGA